MASDQHDCGGAQRPERKCGACPRRQVFKSHCAPEAAAALGPAQLTVAELRARLQALSQPTKGLKVRLALLSGFQGFDKGRVANLTKLQT